MSLRKDAPIAFLSYVHDDDKASFGVITRLREHLEQEVRSRLGDKEFAIFHDRKDITWGQLWQERLRQGVSSSSLFLPIITPLYFISEPCREELSQFLAHERTLGRDDLILPLNLLPVQELSVHSADPLKSAIAGHQWKDWCHLRREPQMSPSYLSALDEAADHIVSLIRTLRTPEPTPTPAKASVSGTGQASDQAKLLPRHSEARPPQTLVVDAMGRANFRTVGEAISAAEPGARILIRPGHYLEALTLDKPLELIGDGAPGAVAITAEKGDVILARTSMGRVVNLTLRQAGTADFAVWVNQGRIEIEDCDIASQGLACVAISNHADPILRRNRIHDGKQGGVYIYEGGRGTIEDNDIVGNTYPGIQVCEDGDPVIRRNRVHDGKQGGILIFDGGRGRIENNDIIDNAYSGIEIRDGSTPSVRDNRIHGNRDGIWIKASGGSYLNNNLSDNKTTAWDVDKASAKLITRADNKE